MDGQYVEYEAVAAPDGSMRVHSELLGVDFYWDGAGRFDILDPATGRTIDRYVSQREALLSAEARTGAAESMREAAEARAESERQARRAAEERIRLLEAELEQQGDG